MTVLGLVWRGLWARRLRTCLLFVSIANAFLLFGLLQGFSSGVTHAQRRALADRLFVSGQRSNDSGLPIAQLQPIAATPGVAAVTYGSPFFATFQSPRQQVVGYAMDIPSFFRVYNRWKVTSSGLAAMARHQDGAIIGRDLQKQWGWKIGDMVPLQSMLWQQTNGAATWTVQIEGVYDSPNEPGRANMMLINYRYLDAARNRAKATVGTFIVRTADAAQAGRIGRTIDNMFSNSPHETKSTPEQELAQQQLDQLGDTDFIVRAVIAATFFSLLVAVGSVMQQAIRERARQIGLLKAIGYSNALIIGLVTGEAMLLCLTAAPAGLAGAATIFPLARNMIGVTSLPVEVVEMGMGLAFVLAALTSSIPAFSLVRLSVITALGRR